MRIRFQADADLNPRIGQGLREKAPGIDFQNAAEIIPDGLPDVEVLRLAAKLGRVLVSRDVGTMATNFAEFRRENDSPGVILIPSARPIGRVIEGLVIAWLHWSTEDLRNQIWWLP